jgi:hypothetical protein
LLSVVLELAPGVAVALAAAVLSDVVVVLALLELHPEINEAVMLTAIIIEATFLKFI